MEKNKEIIQKHCMNCEFCMPNGNELICAGRDEDYGTLISQMIEKFPNGCEEFEYTLNTFILNEKIKEEIDKSRNEKQ